jgi:hypothetical protein
MYFQGFPYVYRRYRRGEAYPLQGRRKTGLLPGRRGQDWVYWDAVS